MRNISYKSTLIGESNSTVALTINGSKIEGYLATEDVGYFMESAKKYSAYAAAEDIVIYKTEDKVEKDDGVCGLDEAVAERMESVKSGANSNELSSFQQDRRILEVATEADYAFVLSPEGGHGFVQSANDQILSLLNLVDALYQRQLGLRIVVTFQHAWDTTDPYAIEQTHIGFLTHFQNYWEQNFQRSNPLYIRDMAHLFSGKIFSTVLGAAITTGTVCISPEFSYSFTAATDKPEMWKVTAHEFGHLLGATHSKGNSIMQAPFRPEATGFSFESIDQIKLHINNYGTCLASDTTPAPIYRTPFDFDGDGEADISVFRPSTAMWHIQQSTAGYYSYPFGVSTDKITPADFDGDGKTDYAVYRAGVWYMQRSQLGFLGISFGDPNDIPVPGDFTGDGRAELVVFRPSNATWYMFDLTNNAFTAQQFGAIGDKPLIMDYDGDHKNDFATFNNGIWQLKSSSSNNSRYIIHGDGNDIPVPADYDGDQQTDIAIFRPSNGTWYVRGSIEDITFQIGQSGDIPVPADYDGDGRADFAIFHPITGVWERINSSTNANVMVYYGQNGDLPLPAFNIIQ